MQIMKNCNTKQIGGDYGERIQSDVHDHLYKW